MVQLACYNEFEYVCKIIYLMNTKQFFELFGLHVIINLKRKYDTRHLIKQISFTEPFIQKTLFRIYFRSPK